MIIPCRANENGEEWMSFLYNIYFINHRGATAYEIHGE
jgi:hypothetical protein